jgi:hypothetical protein
MQKQEIRCVGLCVESCGRTRCIQLADGGLVKVKKAANNRILVSVYQGHHQSSAKSSQTSLDKHYMKLIEDQGIDCQEKISRPDVLVCEHCLPLLLSPTTLHRQFHFSNLFIRPLWTYQIHSTRHHELSNRHQGVWLQQIGHQRSFQELQNIERAGKRPSLL